MKLNRPKISVLMPVKDEQDFLPRAVESILSQSFGDFELIVSDNNSRDASWDVMMNYRKSDPRIKIVRNRNMGFTSSLNMMVDIARGEYIARLDADDASYPDRLKIQSEILDGSEKTIMTGARCEIFDESGAKIYEHGPDEDKSRMRWSMIFRNDFWHSCVMWKNSPLVRYNERFTYAQDYELWSRIAKRYEITASREILGSITSRKKSISNTKREDQNKFAMSVSKRNMEHYLGREITYQQCSDLRSMHLANEESQEETIELYIELLRNFSEREGVEKIESMVPGHLDKILRTIGKKESLATISFIHTDVMEDKIKISKRRWRESNKKVDEGRNYIWLEREARYCEVEICEYEISPAYGASTEKSPWEGFCDKKPWRYEVTAVIPCLNTPETLPICIELLRLQTERPFIMIIDTGSTDKNLRLTEDMRSGDVEVHSIRLNGVRHPSDYPAMAMDMAFSLCRTEYLFATHSDCFLRSRSVLSDFLNLCKTRSPVVGYELSPRAHEDWVGMVSHTASMYHMPTMDKIGFGWSLRRLCNRYGIVDYKPDPNKPNWPDTEILGNYILRDNKIVPHLVGKEGNQCRTLDDHIDHFRSYGAAKMYSPDYYPKVSEWYHSAKKEALERIDEWSRE